MLHVIEMHLLHSHLSFFPANLGDVSDEHGERHHQEMMIMENRYQGRSYDGGLLLAFCERHRKTTPA